MWPTQEPSRRCVPQPRQDELQQEEVIHTKEVCTELNCEFEFNPIHVSSNFVGGQIADCLPFWETLSSDRWLLQCVEGIQIPFVEIPVQKSVPRP